MELTARRESNTISERNDFKVNTTIPFFWVIPLWVIIASTYFLAAQWYLRKKTGFSMWKVWWMRTDHRKTERRFAEEIRKFPGWFFGYQTVKWGTLLVVIGYFVRVFVYLLRR